MNGKTAKILNRLAGKAKRPSRPFKRTWKNETKEGRSQMRGSILRELRNSGRQVGGDARVKIP